MGFGREPPRGIPQQVKSPIDEFVREAAEARRPPPEYAPLAPLRELLEEAKERLGARGPGLATGMGCGVGVGAGVVGARPLSGHVCVLFLYVRLWICFFLHFRTYIPICPLFF